jgi:uncharacterized membrane protein
MVTAAKTASQIGMHMGVAFMVMYMITGSFAFGGVAAIIEPICNVVLMPLHEKVWDGIRKRVAAYRARNQSGAAHNSPQAA